MIETEQEVISRILRRGPQAGRAVLAWLALVKDRGYGHGSELVSAYKGVSDNVIEARDLLRSLVWGGYLSRARFAPTREQQFFDVNGSIKTLANDLFEMYHYAPGKNL